MADETQKKEEMVPFLLHYAEYGDLRLAQELLTRVGIDIEAYDKEGNTALIIAAEKGRVRFLEELIAHGADLNAQNYNGSTALICAIHNGYKRSAEVLIDAGADVNLTTKHKETALMKAAEKGDMDILKSLVAAGADVNKQDKYGLTALMRAVQSGFKDMVLILVEAGADLELKDVTGKTALDWSNVFSRPECMRLLISLKESKEDEFRQEEGLPEAVEKEALATPVPVKRSEFLKELFDVPNQREG